MEKQAQIEGLYAKIKELKSDKNTNLELMLIRNWLRSIEILKR